MITKKLTREEQKSILNELFGFNLEDITKDIDWINTEHWVLYDEEGNEFYGSTENCQFNFSTLAGIFSYIAYRAKKEGYADCQREMRKIIGIFT
jgi:hypothetical protein